MISLTIDLEDPTGLYAPDGRYVHMTQRIMDMCEVRKCRATFFIVGKLATGAPKLIQEIAARGHEVAYHSHAHAPLTQEDPERFARESREDKYRFEELSGKRLTGFRAPAFSLTPASLWALDILAELGFTYSSSIMPTRLSRYGFPVVPRTPFRWPNGMIELPLPVGDLGSLRVPCLGGIYMFAMPFAVTRFWAQRAKPEEVLWTYAHPYDFDREERFIPNLHESFFASTVLWLARFVADKKIGKVLDMGIAPPLGERVKTLTLPDIHW